MEPRKSVLKGYDLISSNGIPCNLGFGAYGSVQLGKCIKTEMTVAIKKIHRKLAFKEVEMHRKLNHPNIIKMYDFFFDEKAQATYIVLEYAENGSLFDYIRQHGLKDKRMIRGIFNSVCDAIGYMHSMDIMHRDIKPENILLDRKNNVKVCDFGFAANCEPRMTLCGTVEYMAPEMILRQPYTHKIDIWGLGILLFELIEGRAPFEGQNQDQVLSKMKKPFFFSKNFTKDEIDLIHRIIKVDPNQRLQIKDILESPCLRNHRNSEESSKRSTMEEDRRRSTIEEEKQKQKQSGKKIKIIEVKELSGERGEKVQKTQKRSSGQIEITSIRDLPSSHHEHPVQSQSSHQPVNSTTLTQYHKGEKISLRKAGRKS